MKTEVRFKGTLADFVQLSREVLSSGLELSEPIPFRAVPWYAPEWYERKTSVQVAIVATGGWEDKNERCYAEATRIPKGCLVRVIVDDTHEQCLKDWTKLHSEMERRGWIDTANNALPSVTDPTDAKTEIISKNQSGGITAQNVYFQGGQMVTAAQAETQGGRAKKVTAATLIIVGALINIVTNVASNTMPIEWKPYLWISWPVLGVLVLISILLLWQ